MNDVFCFLNSFSFCFFSSVLHIGRAMDALSAIRSRKNSLSLVLTNINRLKTKGAEIIQVIEKELNLCVCCKFPFSSLFKLQIFVTHFNF